MWSPSSILHPPSSFDILYEKQKLSKMNYMFKTTKIYTCKHIYIVSSTNIFSAKQLIRIKGIKRHSQHIVNLFIQYIPWEINLHIERIHIIICGCVHRNMQIVVTPYKIARFVYSLNCILAIYIKFACVNLLKSLYYLYLFTK